MNSTFLRWLAVGIAGLGCAALAVWACIDAPDKKPVDAGPANGPPAEESGTAASSVSGRSIQLPPPQESPKQSPADVVPSASIAEQASAFCGACHAMPRAASFPKSAWRKEVAQGYDFYLQSRRSDLVPPVQEKVVAFFKSRAPERLALPELPADDAPPLTFREERLKPPDRPIAEMIMHVHALRLGKEEPPSLLSCDVSTGEIGSIRPGLADAERSLISGLSYPCHIESCDLDQDGAVDLVVAELGSFEPADHDHGRVIWLRRRPADASRWESLVLQAGLGRVADVQPGDFDGDGDIDLVVAEFGYRRSGRILLLRNRGAGDSQIPKFDPEVVDLRHGAIHVPPVDLNGDGCLDFIALISQEHEVIEAFLNDGSGRFGRETIYAAPDPSYGSTGIQLVDLDLDGDLDVLYTNGDTMDSYLVKPDHGVQWLENTGAFPFVHHRLALLPGVMRAQAADLDGDGLPDVAAAAYIPDNVLANSRGAKFDSLIWLRQRPGRQFTRHRIETGNVQHMSLELFDADGDGDIDLFTGNFTSRLESKPGGSRITAWWNSGPARDGLPRRD